MRPVSEVDRMRPVTDDDAPWPDGGAGNDGTAPANLATSPLEARPGQALHVRFRVADADLVVTALEGLRGVLREHPGETPVVLHVPVGAGREQEMQLRTGVAYGPELLAAVTRRLGTGFVEPSLG
jgi:hypothetical protein